jgi:nicotinate-nucleotide pyrophosphorylase
MRYRVELLGRTLGAIGKEHWITCEVEADNPEQAEEKARDQHEVWMLKKVEELTNG